MKEVISNLNEWCYKNLDLIEENLETNSKSVVLISGASCSGKSYSSELLKDFLENKGYKCCLLSTDSYSKGISGIIADKVNKSLFNNKLKNIDEIKRIIKEVIKDTNFDDKFGNDNLVSIKQKLGDLIEKQSINTFLIGLREEFKKINFDEPSVYDLKSVAKDIKMLLNEDVITEKEYSKVVSEQLNSKKHVDGKNYNVVLVEGIYALNQGLLDNLRGENLITNFVECDSKTLFLRRVLRDAKITPLSNAFTIKYYFEVLADDYIKTVLPTKNYANLVLNNNMTFDELRTGELTSTQIKVKVNSKKTISSILSKADTKTTVFERDIYLASIGENAKKSNILRVRTVSTDGKNFVLWSLIHKGTPKLRRDGKIIRPVNILIKDGELTDLYKTEEELMRAFKRAHLEPRKTIIKKRTRMIINGEKLTLDEMPNGEVFVQIDPAKKGAFSRMVKQHEDAKSKEV